MSTGDASPVVGTAVTTATARRGAAALHGGRHGDLHRSRPGTPSWSYTPAAADVGNYLRAFVYYSSGASTPVWTRAATGFTGAVAASN